MDISGESEATQKLYGLDAAKKAIARDRTAVVVEGYTDVMACHLAGVPTAVATCGTATTSGSSSPRCPPSPTRRCGGCLASSA